LTRDFTETKIEKIKLLNNDNTKKKNPAKMYNSHSSLYTQPSSYSIRDEMTKQPELKLSVYPAFTIFHQQAASTQSPKKNKNNNKINVEKATHKTILNGSSQYYFAFPL
jgi:hypothetical protein